MFTALTVFIWQRTYFADQTIQEWGPIITAVIGSSIVLAFTLDIALIRLLMRLV